MKSGRVYIVGAGPGDPGLITLRGLECIRRADIVIYDRLVHSALLSHARPDAEMIYAGKSSHAHTMTQDEINHLLVQKALCGKTIVRLKGGDPFLFGRGGEEAEVLADHGIEFEIVPGVTSAIAVPAYAGIPVTHRDFCSALGIITGHEAKRDDTSRLRWREISAGLDTVVFLMGVENLREIVSALLGGGRAATTPIALIRWGTRPEQQTIVGTLGDIVEKAQGFEPPAVAVVGEVVRLREKLRWYDNRPLFGKKVLVTRASKQADALSKLLREHGAEPVELPVISINRLPDFDLLDLALERIGEFDWLIFTSVNGVEATIQRLWETGRDVRWLRGPRVAAIGPKTAQAVEAFGIRVDYVPRRFISEAIAEEFPESVSGRRILIIRAKEAREVLPKKLAERGATVEVVTAYVTKFETADLREVKELLREGGIDIITFTSSSTVKGFVRIFGDSGRIALPPGIRVACIGPITAQMAKRYGLEPDIVAEDHTIEGLVTAMVAM